MIYIFDGGVSFRSEDSAFFIEDSDEVAITISLTMGRLLTYLIEHHGEVCSRNEILEHVWDAYGLQSSNNSLNKYISDLRKTFSTLGLDPNTIATVPRLGFMLSLDLKISYSQDSLCSRSEKSSEAENPVQKGNKIVSMVTIVFLCLTFLAILVFPFIVQNSSREANLIYKRQATSIGKVKMCRIFSLNEMPSNFKSATKNIVDDLIKRHGISCERESTVFMNLSDAVLLGDTGRVFFAQCFKTPGIKNKVPSCKSVYEMQYNAPV